MTTLLSLILFYSHVAIFYAIYYYPFVALYCARLRYSQRSAKAPAVV